MAVLHIDRLRATLLRREPFDFLIVPGVVQEEAKPALERDFPRIAHAGSFPLSELTYGPAFSALLDGLRGSEFGAAMSEKFGIELTTYPTLITVRGCCGKRDGHVHTDAAWKVVSVLLYLNGDWDSEGGRLRLLRGKNLEDVAVEVPPTWGTLLAFRRSERSFHGHKLFEGERRVVQLNWATDQKLIDREVLRHRRTARLKRLLPFASRWGY
jgi:SM-20-related protein